MKVVLIAVAALLIVFAAVVVTWGVFLWFTPDPEGGRRYFGNLMVAGFAGAFIPLLLERLGADPAVASSIFVTTFTDVCGFLLLLGLAGTMLL